MPSALKAVHVPKRHMRAKQRVETEESCVKQIVLLHGLWLADAKASGNSSV